MFNIAHNLRGPGLAPGGLAHGTWDVGHGAPWIGTSWGIAVAGHRLKESLAPSQSIFDGPAAWISTRLPFVRPLLVITGSKPHVHWLRAIYRTYVSTV